MCFFGFQVFAVEFVSEQATLESIYESKARAVLNTILRPKDYSILISARMNEDEEELRQFREDLEMRFLPGLPIEAQGDLSPATNELHSLKQGVDVNVLLNNDVEENKKELIKKLLISKLHLDVSDGDSINIIKTRMPASIVDKQPKKKPDVKPVIPKDNRLFYFAMVFLAFIAFCLWLFRASISKDKKDDKFSVPEEKENQSPLEHMYENNMNHTIKQEEDDSIRTAQLLVKEDVENERLRLEKLEYLELLRSESLALMTEYPNLCVDAVSDLIRESKGSQVIAFFENIGWDSSRRLMSNLPTKQWGTLGSILKKRIEVPSESDYESALEECHKNLMSKVISHGVNKDKDNPFSFIFTLPYSQKKQIYENEGVSNIAIISLFSNSADLQDIFNFLTPERKKDVILKIADFQKLNDMEIKLLRNQLLERLNNIKVNGGIVANGPEVAAKVLRSLSPAKEQEIFDFIEKTDLHMAKHINNYTLQFSNLKNIPLHYQESIIESMESESVAKLLYGSSAEIQEFVMQMLPKNKARMVKSDLESHILNPSKDEVANLKREVVMAVEAKIEQSGEELSSVINRNPKLKVVA